MTMPLQPYVSLNARFSFKPIAVCISVLGKSVRIKSETQAIAPSLQRCRASAKAGGGGG